MFVCLAEVEAEESSSLKQLQALVSIACEYLGLWKILCDHQFHVIAGALTPISLTVPLMLSLCDHEFRLRCQSGQFNDAVNVVTL